MNVSMFDHKATFTNLYLQNYVHSESSKYLRKFEDVQKNVTSSFYRKNVFYGDSAFFLYQC